MSVDGKVVMSLVMLTIFTAMVGMAMTYPPETRLLPLVIGIRYPDSLTNFVHQEAPPLEAEWTIRLGAANQLLFDKLFGAMFVETVVLDQEADVAAHPELDAVIEPTLEEFEFSLPRQSQTDQYAVWLRYNVRVYTPDGEPISNWPVTAYGQVGAKRMGAEKSIPRSRTRRCGR